MPPPAPRCCGGRLFITAARLGEANMPIETPTIASTSANGRNGEVDRQQRQQEEAQRGAEHPARREPARAEAVGQVSGGRAGDQHAERQRQHVDARPQRRVGEVVAVLGQPDALQPDDQHEHQPAARDRREERRERPERERADAEQRQAEHRLGDASLDRRERDQARHAGAQQPEHPRAAPAGGVAAVGPDAVGDRHHDQDQPERERDVAPPVDGARVWACCAPRASGTPTPCRTAPPAPRSGTPGASRSAPAGRRGPARRTCR